MNENSLFMGSYDIPMSLKTYVAIQDFKEQLSCRVLIMEIHSNPQIKGMISGKYINLIIYLFIIQNIKK